MLFLQGGRLVLDEPGGETCPLWFPDSSLLPHIPASQRLSFSMEELRREFLHAGARRLALQWKETWTLLASFINRYSWRAYYHVLGTTPGPEGAVTKNSGPCPQGPHVLDELSPHPIIPILLTCSGRRGR